MIPVSPHSAGMVVVRRVHASPAKAQALEPPVRILRARLMGTR